MKKLNESIDYNYKNKLNLLSFINKFELINIKYSNHDLILNIFDKIYQNNNILN